MAMVLVVLTGCLSHNEDKRSYTGEYPELYSVAISTLLGAEGQIYSEVPMEASLKVIEEDNYGRKLFMYFEANVIGYSLLISQKSDEEYVYFYPNYNFIIVWESRGDIGLRFTDEKIFSPKAIEELKEYNDWNEEIDEGKCIKVKIVRQKEVGVVKDKQLKRFYEQALGDDGYDYKSSTIFYATDKYGRSIYLGTGKYSSNRYVVMLFQPDSEYDVKKGLMEIRNPQKYQDELKGFKELNGWNEPF